MLSFPQKSRPRAVTRCAAEFARRGLASVIAACCLIAASATPASAAAVIDTRVMTYNIRYGSANDGIDSWDYRKANVATCIKNFAPDLLGLQEVETAQRDYLTNQLTGYTLFGAAQSASGTRNTVAYKTQRYERVDAGNFWMSTTPDVAGSSSWDSAQPRVATWVKLRDRSNPGLTFVLLNNHWDHVSREAREQSALLVRRQLGSIAPGLPVIVAGDLNCQATSVAFTNLKTPNAENPEPLIDAWREARPNTNLDGTFHGFTGDRDRSRIDHVLRDNRWLTVSGDIDRSTYENIDPDTGESYVGRYPSDHFPVEVVLRTARMPGDANWDWKVNFTDLVILAQHYNLSSGQTWLTGDFSGDAAVTFSDLVILAQNYGRDIAAVPVGSAAFAADWTLAQSLVPEPATLAPLSLMALVLRRRVMIAADRSRDRLAC